MLLTRPGTRWERRPRAGQRSARSPAPPRGWVGGLHATEPVFQADAEVTNKLGIMVIHTMACKMMLDGHMIDIIVRNEGVSDDHQWVIRYKHRAEHQDGCLEHSLNVYHVK
jgi:hypothetical protein